MNRQAIMCLRFLIIKPFNLFTIMKTIMICGNLGANAVRRTASDGRELMTFSVAVSAGNDSTMWFNCIGSFREKLFPYLVKGQNVAVVGDLSVSLYKDRIDLTVDVNRIELSGRAPEQPQTPTTNSSQPMENANQQPPF